MTLTSFFQAACSCCSLVSSRPPPTLSAADVSFHAPLLFFRPPPAPALVRRLARLAASQDAAAYDGLVRDVTAAERAEKDKERFGSYRQQLGFGLHVITMMGTGYAVGMYLARNFGKGEAMVRGRGGAPPFFLA